MERQAFPAIAIKRLFSSMKFTFGFALIMAFSILAICAPLLTKYDPFRIFSAQRDLLPSWEHPLGTDSLGRDLFAQLVYGIRASLIIGLLSGAIGTVLGFVIGLISGYKSGYLGTSITRFIDVFICIPSLPILILITAMLPRTSVLILCLVIAIFSWPWTARAIRAQVLSLKERDFINLAKCSGMGDLEIIFKEVLPNILPYIASSFAITTISAMLSEAALSFIGIGPYEVVTLGKIIAWSQQWSAIMRGMVWWWLPPSLSLVLIFIGFQSINMGLDEIFNPRLKRITGE